MDSKRVVAFIIDYLICCVIQAVLFALFIMKPLLENNISVDNIFILTMGITLISSLFLIFRDCLGEKSIGKRIMKLNIVNIEGEGSVGFPRKLLRNITWLLGPIEIICFLVSRKRIGDILAKTTVKE